MQDNRAEAIQELQALADLVACSFNYSLSRKVTTKPQWECIKFYRDGFCKKPGCYGSHTKRNNLLFNMFRVDVKAHPSNYEIYFSFATSLVLHYMENEVEFTHKQLVSLITYFEALLREIIAMAETAHVEFYSTYMIRFVRDLFPITAHFLEHSKNMPCVLGGVHEQAIESITAVMQKLSNEWYAYENDRKLALDSLTKPLMDEDCRIIIHLDQSIKKYYEEQTATRAAQSETNQAIISAMTILTRDMLVEELAGESGYSFEIFGSAGNTLSSRSSDVDVAIQLTTTDEALLRKYTRDKPRVNRIFQQLRRAFELGGASEFFVEEFVEDARIPILAMVHIPSGTKVELSWHNPNAIRNTRLLRRYAEYDNRVRPLVLAIKYWASQRGVSGGKIGKQTSYSVNSGQLTSYGWTLLVIHFLQCGCYPAVLPVLQELGPTDSIDARSATATSHSSAATDCISVGQLFVEFFRYYCIGLECQDVTMRLPRRPESSGPPGEPHYYDHHDFFTQVSDIMQGCCYLKKSAARQCGESWRLSIQDPFDNLDVGRIIWHPNIMHNITTELRRAGKLLIAVAKTVHASEGIRELVNISADRLFEKITRENICPIGVAFTCPLCGSADHVLKVCTQQECDFCHQIGHHVTRCAQRKCKHCNKRGHFSSECILPPSAATER